MGAEAKEMKKGAYWIADDVIGSKVLFVNYYMIGTPGKNNPWVLVDAALPGSSRRIRKEAEDLFGQNNPPKAIILTHGHFDHVGALPELLKSWPEVNVYCHAEEVPYLTGRSSYPPPDPAVGGGGMAYMSWMFPIKPIDIGERLHVLNENDRLPELPDWQFIHTPGHAPGHISLFRERDKVLIAGDAFTTTNQNSVTSVLLQKKEVHGPPAYFTIDWYEAFESVRVLAQLGPEACGTGHGLPFFGEELKKALAILSRNFERKEIPWNGRYVQEPAFTTQEEGVKQMPPPVSFKVSRYVAMLAGIVAIAGIALLVGKRF